MKNLVEAVKLTEPVKAVQSQSMSIGQQKPQQQGQQSSGQDSFQNVLNKQLQDHRMQESRANASRQEQNAAKQNAQNSKSGTTTQEASNSTPATPVAETGSEVDQVEADVIANAKLKANLNSDASAKLDTNANLNSRIKVKSDLAVDAKTDISNQKSRVKDAKLTDEQLDTTNTSTISETAKKTVTMADDMPIRQQPKANPKSTAKASTQTDDQADQALEAGKLAIADQQDTTNELVEKIAKQATKRSEDADHDAVELNASAKHQSTNPVAEQATSQLHNQQVNTEANAVMPQKSIREQTLTAQSVVADKHAQGLDNKPTRAIETTNNAEPIDDASLIEMNASGHVAEDIAAANMPKSSVIAELQKNALEKRQLAKQMGKDNELVVSKASSVKQDVSMASNASQTTNTSEHASDYIQTMNMQAAPIKQAVQRAVGAEAVSKVDEVKTAAAKPVETQTPTIASPTTMSAQSMLSPSTVMSAAPLGSSNQIYAYPGKSGWNQAISQKVMYMVGASEQTARLSLNPPELGPLQVVIEVNDEKANTTFISDNEEVRQALEDGMEYLREKMEEAGIELGQANVNDGHRFSQSQQQSQYTTSGGAKGSANLGQKQAVEQHTVTQVIRTNSNSLVDTFA